MQQNNALKIKGNKYKLNMFQGCQCANYYLARKKGLRYTVALIHLLVTSHYR